jgi:hypothetical protein
VVISGISRSLWAVACMAWCAEAHANDPSAAPPDSSELRAIDFLKSLPREWSGTSDHDCKTYEDKNIEKLSRSFAVSAAEFLKTFVKMHGAVTITSAHRTADEQTCVCVGEKGPCAGKPYVVRSKKGWVTIVGTSRHQDGIALDVRPGTGSENEFICLQEFAKLNPHFGVHFPLGRSDYPHMEPSGSRSGKVQVASLRSTPGVVTSCKKMKIMLTYNHLD